MLTKDEFETLHKLDKYITDINSNGIIWPESGKKLILHCCSIDKKEQFEVNINTSKISIYKVTYQELYSDKTIMFRIDSSGPRHQNPDGTYVECPHIHIFKEGFGDKWAYPLNEHINADATDILGLFEDFLRYINVLEIPSIKYQLRLI